VPIDSWDEERVATLTKLWAEGHSATRIALVLECSRNSVIGKVTRLKLPAPLEKLPVVADRSYVRQLPEISLEKRRTRERHYAKVRREKRRQCIKTNQDVRAQLLARGKSTTSAIYRNQFPPLPDMSKNQLRAMLAAALQNTAAL
jgi:hypothetical protein